MTQTRNNPAPQQIYRHFKGNLYQIQSIAYHSETGEQMVVYQALYGDYRFYVRPLEMFMEEVDHNKYPSVSQRYRFELVNVAAQAAQTPQVNITQQTNQPSKSITPVVFASVEAPVSPNVSSEELIEELDEDVVRFLDADNYSDRLEILTGIKYKITDDMIDIMSTVIDIEVKSGPVERRYEDFKNALMTRRHYEGTRLR